MVENQSERASAKRFGISRKTVSKMIRHIVPPGYQRKEAPVSPKPGPKTLDRYLPGSGISSRSTSSAGCRNSPQRSQKGQRSSPMRFMPRQPVSSSSPISPICVVPLRGDTF